MNLHFKKFLIQTIGITLTIFILGSLYVYIKQPDWFNISLIFLLFGYMLFSWGIQCTLFHYGTKKLSVFNRAFMIITGVKLIFLMILMVIVGFFFRSIFKNFLIELLLLYLLFSFIEVRSVLKYIKGKP